ncbi:MAG: DUF4838 domain-containing protein [Clostridia bacterium]|nr:DUF4838 domain-containing protein [Clostridia bacterium]
MKNGMIVHPGELSKKWIDRLADAGINTLGIHPEGGKDAPKSLERLLGLLRTPEYRALIDYARSRGLEVEYECHAAGYLMDRALFAEHPEYFRMNEAGDRIPDWNFCVSNEDALTLFAKRAAALALNLYGSSKNFYFWMDDGRGIHCQCPKCRALSPSDQQYIALRAALREIRKHIPEARLAYLAYIDTIQPPTIARSEDGLFLEYAPFEKYTAKGEDSAIRIERERGMIAPLLKYFGGEDAKVLEYWYDNSLFSNWKKPPARFSLNADAMSRDIRDYRAMGFDRISTFACFLGNDYEELYGEVDVMPFAKAFE